MKALRDGLTGLKDKLKPAKARRWVVLGLGISAIGIFYALAKVRDERVRQMASGEREAPLHKERIFESSSAAVAREKEGHLSRSARALGGGVQTVKDDVRVLRAEFEKLKSELLKKKSAGDGSPSPASELPGAGPSVNNQAAPAQVTAQAPGNPGSMSPASDQANAPAPGGPNQKPGGEPPLQAASREAFSRRSVRPLQPPLIPVRGPTTVSFPVKGEEGERLGVTLPAGAFVKARMLTGVAAPEGRPYPALLALDYAHVLPNRHRLDLSGCFMIAKAQGDLSTERLQMQGTKLSCVGSDGRMFERDVSGFVADDKDNNFAVAGEVQSKQDRVAVMAFLASVVEGVGKAIQQAQTSQQVMPGVGSETIITGNQQKYLAAGGVSDAAGQVASWYLKEAQNLLPTINVNSGRQVWVVMQESVSLPSSYFKRPDGGGDHDSAYSYVTRLLE